MKPSEVVPLDCAICPRLASWRSQVAFSHGWAKPVPGFGSKEASIMLVGLAPSRLGANRTGRMFTGDQTGKWLYRRLFEAGLANQARSEDRFDGLSLPLVYLTTAVKCVPPQNKPSSQEVQACAPYLLQELEHLPRLKVVVALGRLSFTTVTKLLKLKACFKHGLEMPFLWKERSLTLLSSYHPSPQNTQTGLLTDSMGHQLFLRARELQET